MIHLITSPITEKKKPVELIEGFYRLNAKWYIGEEVSTDIPLLYHNDLGDLMVNENYVSTFKNYFQGYAESSVYREALLLIDRTHFYKPLSLACDVAEVLYTRLEHAHRIAFDIVENVPESYECLMNKYYLYKHFSLMCMVTGCFYKADYFLPKCFRYLTLANARREWETNQNNKINQKD